MAKKDLIKIIKENPGCVAQIDNDCWALYKKEYLNQPPDIADEDKWVESMELASSYDDIIALGDGGYGTGNCYGGDILQALAKIVGITIQSV